MKRKPLGPELEEEQITCEAIYGKESLIPIGIQRISVSYQRVKLAHQKHVTRCLDCLTADSHCDQCQIGAALLREVEWYEKT